jgi:DNA-directed RNA polymerase specialized sigma24 family protein
MVAQVQYRDHEKLIQHTAHRVMRRIYNLGTSAAFDDIVQELSIAWCIARRDYDPAMQVPFVPWLMRGMIQHINRWVGNEILHHNDAHIDLDADIEEGTSAHDLIADNRKIDAETAIVRKDMRERNLARLSPIACKFLELLDNPPPALIAVLRAQKARFEYAKDRGVSVISPTNKRITAAMVFDLMGVANKDRTAINKEIEEIARRK